LVLLLALPFVLLSCALAAIWLPMPRPFPAPNSHDRHLIAALTTGCLGFGYLIALTRLMISQFMQAGRALDPVLSPIGLASRNYLLFGRQYDGPIRGRRVVIEYLPPQKLKPALLNVRVSAQLHIRAAIGQQRPSLDCRDCPVVELAAPDVGQIQVFTRDERWIRSLFAMPANRVVLSRLLGNQDTQGHREIYLQPDQIPCRFDTGSTIW
jgi:hypothetical protein